MAETVVTDEARDLVDQLPEPVRYVWAVVSETVDRLVLVDEDDAADIASAEHRHTDLEPEFTYGILEQAKAHDSGMEALGYSSDVYLARSWQLPDVDEDDVCPQEACPHCGGTCRNLGRPQWTDHTNACPLRRHYVGMSGRDHDARTVWASCSCGWEGPHRPDELDESRFRTHELSVQLALDGREHLTGRIHSGHVRRDLGLPDLPAEYGCWRPVPGVEISHLIERAAAVARG